MSLSFNRDLVSKRILLSIIETMYYVPHYRNAKGQIADCQRGTSWSDASHYGDLWIEVLKILKDVNSPFYGIRKYSHFTGPGEDLLEGSLKSQKKYHDGGSGSDYSWCAEEFVYLMEAMFGGEESCSDSERDY